MEELGFNWISILSLVLGSGSVIYLLIDKLVMSRKDKEDVDSIHNQSLRDTLQELTRQNEVLHRDLDHSHQREDELRDELDAAKAENTELKSDLFAIAGKFINLKYQRCRVYGCPNRKPDSEYMKEEGNPLPDDPFYDDLKTKYVHNSHKSRTHSRHSWETESGQEDSGVEMES